MCSTVTETGKNKSGCKLRNVEQQKSWCCGTAVFTSQKIKLQVKYQKTWQRKRSQSRNKEDILRYLRDTVGVGLLSRWIYKKDFSGMYKRWFMGMSERHLLPPTVPSSEVRLLFLGANPSLRQRWLLDGTAKPKGGSHQPKNGKMHRFTINSYLT